MAENNHIEEFFRKHLASREFAYQEEDWLKLEKKLELSGTGPDNSTLAHMPVRLILIILAALTAAFFLGWLTRDIIRNKKNFTTQNITPVLPSNKDVIVSGTETKNYKNTTGEQASSGEPAEEKFDFSVKIYEVTNPDSPANSPEPSASLPDEYLNSEVPDEYLNTEVEAGLNEMQILQKPVSGMLYSKELIYPAIIEPFKPLHIKTFRRWSVGVLLAPDMNSTGFLHRKSVSPAYGAVVSYSFTPRWSVSARVLYNNKKYKSTSEYYSVPDGYWEYRTNGVIPDEIDASCRVIDVPVILSYIYYKQKRVTLKASAGIGSYFLMDEVYRFSFDQPNPGADAEWKTNENSKVWFSVANLAAGISLNTGNRTSLTIEPYLKLPLKKMGWADVNLSGMGIAFTFSYAF